MFSTLKRITALCIIAVALNIFVGIAVVVFASGSGFSFTEIFSICTYVITTSLILTILSCGLRSTCTDLEVTAESNENRIRDLKKRIEELEARIK